MTLDELIKHLTDQLAELKTREDAGEDVAAEKARLEAEKAAAEERKQQQSTTPESEADLLRKQLGDIQRRDTAREIAKSIVQETVARQQAENEELATLVRKEVETMMGGSDLQSLVRDVVSSTRQPSRFVGTGAAPDLVDHVAKGGSVQTIDNGGIQVTEKGAKAEAKAILDSKSMGRFFSIIAKAHRSEMFLTPGEKEFLYGTMGGKAALAEMTDTAGGFLVPQQWMPDILGLLRASAVVRRAGGREIPFNKLMNQTSISTGASASYTGENLRITPSDMTFAEAPLLSPKNLTALVPVSNYLLADAEGADGIIRADMTDVMVLAEDFYFLRGDGTSGAPIGLRNKVGVTEDPLTVPTDGIEPTISQLRAIKAYYRNNNAGAVRLAWFFNPAFLGYLEGLTDADGHFLLDTNLLRINEDNASGVLDGTPFYTTTQIPVNLTVGASNNATDVMLVNMAETIIGNNQSLEIAVSDQASWTSDGTNWNSAFQQNQTLFRAVLRHDIAHRRPAQIVVQTGVLV